MAKSNKAAITRIATTVTARYYPTSGATDGFFLDGRLSGRREHRAADITLDREERGFFYAIYAHLAGTAQEDTSSGQVRKSLDKIMNEVKQPGHNIDAEINELAECAVSVVGRIALKHDGMRQPYFAGILVRDSEMAAVTMGSGCAYLYRGDVLYPLTTDDYPLEAIDFAGKPVTGLDVYCAGVAGTVRYSNIAQLQLDDCLIVCNREVMEALGQREVLRMLYEAEDQADAAGMVMTSAAAKLPGTPMQFMIGFIENITSADRTGRSGMTRGSADTAAGAAAAGAAGAGAAAAGSAAAFAATSRSKPQPPQPAVPKMAAAELPVEEDVPDLLYTEPRKSGRTSYADRTQPLPVKSRTSLSQKREPDLFDDEDDSFGDEIDTYGRGRRIAFYIIIAAVCIGCIVLIYNMLFKRDNDPAVTTTTTASGTATPAPTTSTTSGGSETTGSQTSEPSATTNGTSASTTAPTTTASFEVLANHEVVAGDSLWGIAKKYYGSGSVENIQRIMDANGMTGDMDKQVIKVGEVLIIPKK
jgi:LysM repeat protein